MTPALLDAAAAALAGMLPFTQPADVALSKFFRSRPKLGGRDRACGAVQPFQRIALLDPAKVRAMHLVADQFLHARRQTAGDLRRRRQQ